MTASNGISIQASDVSLLQADGFVFVLTASGLQIIIRQRPGGPMTGRLLKGGGAWLRSVLFC